MAKLEKTLKQILSQVMFSEQLVSDNGGYVF